MRNAINAKAQTSLTLGGVTIEWSPGEAKLTGIRLMYRISSNVYISPHWVAYLNTVFLQEQLNVLGTNKTSTELTVRRQQLQSRLDTLAGRPPEVAWYCDEALSLDGDYVTLMIPKYRADTVSVGGSIGIPGTRLSAARRFMLDRLAADLKRIKGWTTVSDQMIIDELNNVDALDWNSICVTWSVHRSMSVTCGTITDYDSSAAYYARTRFIVGNERSANDIWSEVSARLVAAGMPPGLGSIPDDVDLAMLCEDGVIRTKVEGDLDYGVPCHLARADADQYSRIDETLTTVKYSNGSVVVTYELSNLRSELQTKLKSMSNQPIQDYDLQRVKRLRSAIMISELSWRLLDITSVDGVIHSQRTGVIIDTIFGDLSKPKGVVTER